MKQGDSEDPAFEKAPTGLWTDCSFSGLLQRLTAGEELSYRHRLPVGEQENIHACLQ